MKQIRRRFQIKNPQRGEESFASLGKGVILVLSALLATGCSSLILKPADFSWPIEAELNVDTLGVIQESRYSIVLNVKPLLYEETKDSVNVKGDTINVIRDARGFYFFTGPQFKNVYVFRQSDGGLKLEKKIQVSKDGMSFPAFNQRVSYIELINGSDKPIMLTKDGIQEEKK
ncbi:MAG: hypothetical protein WAO19_11950 [Candidatus Kryptoniota bacterium]